MCEIACQVRRTMICLTTMATNLMITEFGFCHGGSLGSRAERVTALGP